MSEGPGGIRSTSKDREKNTQGIRGAERTFYPGDKIIVTWFNHNKGNGFTIHPRISFNDSDHPKGGKDGQWQFMSKLYMKPQKGGVTTFVFDKKTAGTYSLINIQVENQTSFKCVCDKIELYLNDPSSVARP